MADIDDYLAEGASAEERQAAEQVLMGLDSLRLQEKITRAATERARLQKLARQRMAGFIILLAILLAGGLYWWRSTALSSSVESSQREIPSSAENDTVPATPPDGTAPNTPEKTVPPTTTPEEAVDRSVPTHDPPPTKNIPIAQTDPSEMAPLPDPLHDAPMTFLRGQSSTVDSVAQQRLNQLWYTSYPLSGLELGDNLSNIGEALQGREFTQAFIRVQRAERRAAESDTLTYLKAYTLLEMGQGAEAARLLAGLETIPTDWQAQRDWYQALAQLLAGEMASAQALITRIAQQDNHPYRQEAQKAMAIYGWE